MAVEAPADVINDIVGSRSIPANYRSLVTQVIEAFENRDADIVSDLLDMKPKARKLEEALTEIGLIVEPEPEPEPVATNGDTPTEGAFDQTRLASTLHRIDARLEALEAVARRAGMMGSPVRD